MKSNALLDKDFLKRLDEWNQKEIFVKLISLDFQENPREEIQGYVTGGSINVDGSSSLRRTCNLTLVTEQINVNEFYWSLHTKFKVYIGLKNYIDNVLYDDIIWFPQGTYIIVSYAQSLSLQGRTITIQGKDKMCLLDGSIGGNLFASHDFGEVWTYKKDGSVLKDKIPIYDIIRNAVHTYAQEPYQNIVINDLDDCAVELISYRAKSNDLFVYNIYSNLEDGTYTSNIVFEGSLLYTQLDNGYTADGDFITIDGYQYEIVKKVTYGDTVGYRLTDLTYAGELIFSAGSALTAMLDAIVKMLGEFEYYYDINGTFIFQRSKIYYNVAWTNAVTNERETYYDSSAANSSDTYVFSNGLLITSFDNKPTISNIKNDYAIWGNLTTAAATYPIHLRYGIDDKPTSYYSMTNHKTYTSDQYDWREIIYQMALDNLNGYEESWGTGYDSYYTDLLEFWPKLYASERPYTNKVDNDGVTYKEYTLTQNDYNFWIQNSFWNPDYVICVADSLSAANNQLKIINPEGLFFWFDFIDNDANLNQYKPSIIGKRTKVVNDNDVKAIFFRETPNILFIDPTGDEIQESTSLSYVKMNLVGGIANYFTISSQGKSAKEALDNLVYNGTYYCETISITCIPIYYLEPNTRIKVYDEASGINGEYLIKSFSLQLSHNGTMSITATKAEQSIL